jgi:hypothetical protein
MPSTIPDSNNGNDKPAILGASGVFVTAISDIKNMNASQIAVRLTIPIPEN